MTQPLIQRQTAISGNVVLFSRFLRNKGFTITSSEEEDLMTALQLIPPTTEARYKTTLRAILCKTKHHFLQFDDLYNEYKDQVKKAVDSKTKNLKKAGRNTTPKVPAPSLNELKSWLYQKPVEEQLEIASYSNLEVLTNKDFSMLTPDEIELITRLLQKLTKRILRKKSRNTVISKKKAKVDLARSLRKNLRKGTSIDEIIHSRKKEKRLKLVLLCDVSRSMDLYSRFFIQMIYAFQKSYDRIETFVFSTVLHRVTEILEENSFDKAFEILADRIPEWSGGTKIGKSLQTFCHEFAYGCLDRKTVVLVLSDGWDTGDELSMRNSFKLIHKEARKIIWLNPLAGNPDFKPDVMGLQVVLPYIQKMVAAHNLESLKRALYSI